MNKADESNWLNWLGHLAGQPNVNGGEIGVFAGESAVWMCQNIFNGQRATYIGIDPFTGNVEHIQGGEDMLKHERSMIEITAPFKQFTLLRMQSVVALKIPWMANSLDFIFIDGAHDAMNVLRDAVLAWECLKVGGIMVFDDYLWEVFPDAIDQPRMAVDAFLSCYAKQIERINPAGEWQVCVRKIG